MRRYWVLALLSVAVIGVYADSHSLRYYETGVSSPGSGLPEYSSVGYVDDRQITNYNSDTRLCLPKTEWMKKLEAEYWERETQRNQGAEPVFKHNVQTVMKRFNQIGGIHSFQHMYGCELRDDGSTAGYDQYGYDGREFMSLDTQSWLWIPTMNEAQLTTQRWNSPEERKGERDKNYLQNECIEWLKKHINNGREDLEKRVRPEVKVWGRHQSDGMTRLQCLVYGFHPQAVYVRWMKNRVDLVPSYEMTPILPHPDGTYQVRVGVEVPTNEADAYSCHVEHPSLGDETLSVIWDPQVQVPHSFRRGRGRISVKKGHNLGENLRNKTIHKNQARNDQQSLRILHLWIDESAGTVRGRVDKTEQSSCDLARLDAVLQDLSYAQIRRVLIWTRHRISALEKEHGVQPSPEEPAWFQLI